MKTICLCLYHVCNWFGWGPLAIIDGLVSTVTLNFIHPQFGVRFSFWAWDHFRAPYLAK